MGDELNSPKPRYWIIDIGVTFLIAGLLLVIFFLVEPSIYNKTGTDLGFMLLGLSIQLLGLACVIIGKK